MLIFLSFLIPLNESSGFIYHCVAKWYFATKFNLNCYVPLNNLLIRTNMIQMVNKTSFNKLWLLIRLFSVYLSGSLIICIWAYIFLFIFYVRILKFSFKSLRLFFTCVCFWCYDVLFCLLNSRYYWVNLYYLFLIMWVFIAYKINFNFFRHLFRIGFYWL